jgi:Tfp pilus assembly protein PilF
MYQRALEQEEGQTHVGLLCTYGNLLQARGELDEAEALYQHALGVDPRHVRTLNSYGTFLLGRYI